jgi:hypothetical protein
MHNACKKLLGAALLAVAMMLPAGDAAATSVTTEPGGSACPPLTGSFGGCTLHVGGEMLLQGHVFGIESTASDCNLELTGRIDSSGQGKFDKMVFTDHAGLNDCTRTPCPLLPIAFAIAVTHPGLAILILTWCFVNDSGSNQQTCTTSLPLTGSGHSYGGGFHVTASANTNAPGCEVEGQLNLESTSIELN